MGFSEATTARALVVGAQGQVGLQMKRWLEAEGRSVLPTARKAADGWLQLDLETLGRETSAESLLENEELSMVLCVGGMTHVDGCESQPQLAYQVNAYGPAALAAYAHRRELPFAYFSTEYVFAGDDKEPGPYAEDAPAQPLSVYGKSKWEGERAVSDAHPEALIVRTTVVYGQDDREKNYLYTLMRNLRAGVAMQVPEDQVSTPTYNRDLARATIGLMDAGASGVFHVCGPEVMGRLEFAQRVARELGLDADLLTGVSTAELGQIAPRPLRAGLQTDKLRREFPQLTMRTLQEGLADCRAVTEEFLARKA